MSSLKVNLPSAEPQVRHANTVMATFLKYLTVLLSLLTKLWDNL